jgi:enamine deaminase RidA (YjgF/YER057c/UK114 family)
MDPNTGDLVSGGVEEQCRQALQNMGAILKAAGADYGNGK